MMRFPFCFFTAAMLALTMSGCGNQDPDQPAVGSISIKARTGAVNERAKLPRSAKKVRGQRNS
jgi:hypothetical protein